MLVGAGSPPSTFGFWCKHPHQFVHPSIGNLFCVKYSLRVGPQTRCWSSLAMHFGNNVPCHGFLSIIKHKATIILNLSTYRSGEGGVFHPRDLKPQKTINFGVKLSFILSFLFAFHCSYLYNYYCIISLKSYALDTEFHT